MRLIVADTGPINYLVLIDHIELLPKLFDQVAIPNAVHQELSSPDTPSRVFEWISAPPHWLSIRIPDADAPTLQLSLDWGETDVIMLALDSRVDLVLMDDREGVRVAREIGLKVTGTLGLLDLAARSGLIDLAAAFQKLKATSFYYRQGLMDEILARRGSIQ